MVFVQHMYDAKKRLSASAVFHVAIADWKSGKTMPIREALKKMDSRPEDAFLLGDLEMNDPEEMLMMMNKNDSTTKPNSFQEILENVSKNAETYDLSGFQAKNPEHSLVHEKALFASALATARITQAGAPQRKWWRNVVDVAVPSAQQEGKSEVKK